MSGLYQACLVIESRLLLLPPVLMHDFNDGWLASPLAIWAEDDYILMGAGQPTQTRAFVYGRWWILKLMLGSHQVCLVSKVV